MSLARITVAKVPRREASAFEPPLPLGGRGLAFSMTSFNESICFENHNVDNR